MEWLFTLLIQKPWGDLASIVGLLVSVFGFGWTVWLAWRSKRAAEVAQEEVRSVRQALTRSSTIADFAAVVTTMNEIKRLHRMTVQVAPEARGIAWAVLPERYAALRSLLRGILSMNPGLNETYQTAIQNALGHFQDMEAEVEQALLPHGMPPNPSRLNRIVSKQIDTLSEILETIKQDVGSE